MAAYNCPRKTNFAYQTLNQVNDIFSNIFKGSSQPSQNTYYLDYGKDKKKRMAGSSENRRLREIMKIADTLNPINFFSNNKTSEKSKEPKKTKEKKSKKSQEVKKEKSPKSEKPPKAKKSSRKSSQDKEAPNSEHKSKHRKKLANSDDKKGKPHSIAEQNVELPKFEVRKKVVYLGTYTVNPEEYIQKYGDNLVHFSKHINPSLLDEKMTDSEHELSSELAKIANNSQGNKTTFMVRNPTPKIRWNETVTNSIPSKSQVTNLETTKQTSPNKSILLNFEQPKKTSDRKSQALSFGPHEKAPEKKSKASSLTRKSKAFSIVQLENVIPNKTVLDFEPSEKPAQSKSLATNFGQPEIPSPRKAKAISLRATEKGSDRKSKALSYANLERLEPSEKLAPSKTELETYDILTTPRKSLGSGFYQNEKKLDSLLDQIVKLEDKVREDEYDLSSFKRISIIPKMDSFLSVASLTNSSDNRSRIFSSKLEKNDSISSMQIVLNQLNSHLKKRYESRANEINDFDC